MGRLSSSRAAPISRPGEGDQAGEALGADHGFGTSVGAARPGTVALGKGAAHRVGDLELAVVAVAKQDEALPGVRGELGRVEQAGVLAPAQDPGDQLPRRGVVGLEDRAAAADAVRLGRLAKPAVAAEVALDQPGDPLAHEDRRAARDLAHLPFGAGAVVAAVEVLGRLEVVLGLGRVGDLGADPREAEDAHLIAFVGVADEIELAVAEDEVVGVDLAVGYLVALQRVVGELDRLAARDRGLDLRQPLGELAAAARVRELDLDRRLGLLGERARTPPGDLLEREPQRLGVGELAIEQAQRGPQRGELGVGELDRRQVVVLGRQRVELGLEEALGGLLDLQHDPEALELGPVRVEAAREGVLVHRAVSLDLALDLQRRHRAAVGHQERDQGELADQLLGVLGHPPRILGVRRPAVRRLRRNHAQFAIR